MTPLVLSTALATGTAMLASFAYLFWRTGERFLGFWMGAGALATLRWAVGMGALLGGPDLPLWLLPVLALGRGLLMYVGGRFMVGRPAGAAPFALVAVGLVWIVGHRDALGTASALWLPYALFTLGFVLPGLALARAERFPVLERRVTGAAIATFGLVQLAYLPAQRSGWVLVVGTAATAALQTAIAIGMLVTFLRASLLERERAVQQEQAMLTQALSAYVSICMHCRSIRDGDVWRDPASARGDAAEGAEVLCDACLAAEVP